MVKVFVEGETVLCFHGILLYSSKLIKIRVKGGKTEYLVHYLGWNKNWDEWVPESRVLKRNPTNLARQAELQRYYKYAPIKNRKSNKADETLKPVGLYGSDNEVDSRSSTPDPRARVKGEKWRESPTPSRDGTSRSKRTKHELFVETETQYVQKVEIRIKIPDELKPWIVDDMLLVTDQKKQAILPAKITIDNVLDMYMESKKAKSNDNIDRMCVEVVRGIKEYINSMLPSKLIYKNECHVTEFIESHPDLSPTQFCGPNYFLRFFTRLGPALAYTSLSEKTMSILVSVLQDVLKFLASNVAIFFGTSNYA